jgi:multidrug efflux pump subunit AcrA (membrane-fusion protein)
MEVAVFLPEARMEELRKIGKAQVRFWTEGPTVPARLREVSSMADPLTRNFAARLALQSAPDGIQYGMSAVARFERTEVSTGFKIPLTALFAEEGKSWVFLLDEAKGIVTRVNIVPSDIDGNQFVVKSGLSEGQLVVVAGTHVLKEGQGARRFIEPTAQSKPAGSQGSH